MGLMDKIVQKYACDAIMDILKEKCPPVYKFIDSLDGLGLFPAIGILLKEHERLSLEVKQGTKVIIKEIQDQLNIMNYVIDVFMGTEPFTHTAIKFCNELGIKEVAGVNVEEFIINLSNRED